MSDILFQVAHVVDIAYFDPPKKVRSVTLFRELSFSFEINFYH